MRFRVMTYNIHKGIGGVDRRYRLERVIEAIARCEADIVLLQEVDDGVPRSNHHRQVDMLGDALDLPHRAFQRNVMLTEGHYGNAILSRFPLTDIQNLDLTVPLKKRRRALIAHCNVRFDGHQHTMLIFNFHLGLAGFERRIQLRRVLSCPLLKRTHQRTAVIVAGDYNDVWGRLGRQIMEPANFLSVSENAKTFPAMLPVRPLDRIFYRGRLSLDHSYVSRTKVAREASDHLPLVAEFELQTE
ncbi:MAG: endonuclease/exonuclease/phosphatase family protein [Planctomycetales bacterium]|nr:endonuclease/exonuclease/phosphatase family protein [Planctomycetales bacterium]